MHSPIRWAEKAAYLDMLSNGRVEFGTGRSSTWNELGGFEANVDDTKKKLGRVLAASYPKCGPKKGFHMKVIISVCRSGVSCLSQLQEPHPPMWVAVTAPGTELDAADRGMGALILSISDVERNVPRIQEYREHIKTCEPVGDFINDQVAIANWMYCHEDSEHAKQKGKRADRNLWLYGGPNGRNI